MTTIRLSATTVVLCETILVLLLPGKWVCSGGEPERKIEIGTRNPTVQQAIENRFGHPDRIVGEENSLLAYRLENGDFLTIVLANDKVVGIEHTAKVDLKKIVGKKVTLVGVYSGWTKANDQILMLDGQRFWLQGRNKASEDGKLFSATGVLKYSPGTQGPPDVQGIPPHYYMESGSAEIKILYPFKFVKRRPIESARPRNSQDSAGNEKGDKSNFLNLSPRKESERKDVN